jgi:hypothetical protein
MFLKINVIFVGASATTTGVALHWHMTTQGQDRYLVSGFTYSIFNGRKSITILRTESESKIKLNSVLKSPNMMSQE